MICKRPGGIWLQYVGAACHSDKNNTRSFNDLGCLRGCLLSAPSFDVLMCADNMPQQYKVPADFAATVLQPVDLSSKAKVIKSVPQAVLKRYQQLQNEAPRGPWPAKRGHGPRGASFCSCW